MLGDYQLVSSDSRPASTTAEDQQRRVSGGERLKLLGESYRTENRSEVLSSIVGLIHRPFIQRAIKDLLKAADVILCTTSGASLDGPLKYVTSMVVFKVTLCVSRHLPEGHFGLTVIDECGQVS